MKNNVMKLIIITVFSVFITSCSVKSTLFKENRSKRVEKSILSNVIVESPQKGKIKKHSVKNSLKIKGGSTKKYTTSNKKRKTWGSGKPSSIGSVYVKGYYRKDGTYVKPHKRKRPKSGKSKRSYNKRRKSYKKRSYRRRSYRRRRY